MRYFWRKGLLPLLDAVVRGAQKLEEREKSRIYVFGLEHLCAICRGGGGTWRHWGPRGGKLNSVLDSQFLTSEMVLAIQCQKERFTNSGAWWPTAGFKSSVGRWCLKPRGLGGILQCGAEKWSRPESEAPRGLEPPLGASRCQEELSARSTLCPQSQEGRVVP